MATQDSPSLYERLGGMRVGRVHGRLGADARQVRSPGGRAGGGRGDGPDRPALRRRLSGRSGDCKCAECQQRKSKPISHVLLLKQRVADEIERLLAPI
jgi:hypothetical protein